VSREPILRAGLVCALLVGGVVVLGQGTGSLLNLRGTTDSGGALVTTSQAFQGPAGALQNFANIRVKTDANGALVTTQSTAAPLLVGDGTAGAPAYSFASEPTLGFWRSSAGVITAQTNNLASSGSITSGAAGNVGVASARFMVFGSRAVLGSPADGAFTVTNQAQAIGSQLKVDALPTIASGFGTSPAVTAGSTPLAGSVNVGTGAPGTTGTITFGGTAFPSAPFCQANNAVTLQVVKAAASTTQLVLTSAGFTASDVVTWLCVSSK
jgi:hypothetical protein